MGESKGNSTRFCGMVANNRTRSNENKLKYNKFPLNIKKKVKIKNIV